MKQITISSFYIFADIFIVLLLIICIIIIIRRYKNEKEEKIKILEKLSDLEIKSQSMELESIKYKLNPHLFKNTLNSIQSHAYQTYYALDNLSNVLDFILYESDRDFVSLKEEIEFDLHLIEINKLKVSPLFDLSIKNNIDVNSSFYESGKIASLITADLIENSFKHATFKVTNHLFTLLSN